MSNNFKCPHCGKEVEITDAISHQIEERITSTLSEKHKKEIEAATRLAEENIKEKIDNDLKEKDQQILALQKKSKEEVEATVEKARKQFENEMKILKEERDEEKERNNKLSKKLDELLEETKLSKRKSDEDLFELKKKFIEQEEQIRNEATKKERERADLDLKEMRKKLEDTQKALLDAQSKAKQGSQQLQGEVLELDLEEKLKQNFVYDEIAPIGKGVQGADILQIVKNQSGKIAGSILWETKRAKWTPSWVPKLKEDGRKNNATMVVLVTETLPSDIENFKVVDGVLVTSRSYSLSLAGLLRRNLMLIAQAKSAADNKDEMLEILYQYLQSDAFRHRFESFTDGIKKMEEDLLTERRSMERIWKKRETQLQRMGLNSARMYGEFQGILGDKLPEIRTLELDSGEE